MNNVINKIKIINAYRDSKYNLPLNKLIDMDNLNSYENFLDNESLNGNMLYFLSKQNPEDRMYLFENLITNEFIHDFLNNYNYTPKLSKDNLKWFLLFLNLNNLNLSVVQSFMHFFEDINNFVFKDSFELTDFICNQIYDNGHGYSYSSSIFIKLLSILKNENLNGFSFNEISEILDNVPVDIDLSNISTEVLKIYTDSLSTLLPEVTIKNYNFCKLINSLCGYEFLMESKYWIKDTFSYSDKIYSILNLLNDNEKSFYLKEILKSYNTFYHQNYCDYFDSFLDKLFMKISYGERYSSSKDILIAGLEVVDKFDSINIMFDLAKIKSIGSKGLYKKAIEDENLSSKLVLYVYKLKDLSRFIDLGSLNEMELKSLIKYLYHGISVSKLEGLSYKISFKEFELLLHNNLTPNAFEYTKDLKLAQRLKIINILISAEKQSNGIYNISDIINTLDVSELLKKHNTFGYKDIQIYIDWKMISSKVSFDISSIEELVKIKAYVRLNSNLSLLNVSKNSIDDYVLNLDYIKDGFKKLDISEAFVLENKENAIKFILDGGFDIALSYHNNYYVKPLQRKNLSLIVKSILVDKYSDLKFNYDDISREIEFNVNRDSFNNWVKDDEVSNEVFTVKDTGDFNTIMTIGVNPVRSCMNYNGGSYSYCLLSNIDTAKKILTIHKNGVYVGRAILRLTKSNSTGDNSKLLNFIDVETNTESIQNNSDEKLVLFVEKMYTSLDANDLVNVYSLMVDFLKQKAASIGAELMMSHYYNSVATSSTLEVRRKDTYLFITASKNGAQYLDSLDGSTTYSCCYKETEVLLY